MAERLNKAVLELTTDTAQFMAGVEQAEQRLASARRSMADISKDVAAFGQSMSDVGLSLTKWVTGPILGATAAMTGLVVAQANTGDTIAKNAREAGLSATAYQELAFALGQVSKLTEDELTRGFASLTKAIADAALGSERHQQILQGLGFSMAEIRSGSIDTETAFERLTQALQSTDNQAVALKLASELLGEEVGRRLAGALRESGDQVEALRAKFAALGLGWTDEQLDQAETFSDAISLMSREMNALGREVATAVLPVIVNDLIPFLREQAIPVLRDLTARITDAIKWFLELPVSTQLAAAGFTAFAAVFGPLLMAIGQFVKITGTLIGKLPALASAIKGGASALLGPTGFIAGSVALSEALYRVGDGARDSESWLERVKGAVLRNLTPWGQLREQLDRVRRGWEWYQTGEPTVTAPLKRMTEAGLIPSKDAAIETEREVLRLAKTLGTGLPAASAEAALGLGKVTAKAKELAEAIRRVPLIGQSPISPDMGESVREQLTVGNWLTDYLSKLIKQPSVTLPENLVGPEVRQGFWKSIFGDAKDFGAYLSSTVMGALQGGGSVSKALGAGIGGQIGVKAGQWASNAVKGVSGALSGALGAAIPVLGSIGGSLLGGLVSKLFGPSAGAIAGKEADAQIQAMQRELLSMYGSIDNIRKVGGAAGEELANAWGSKNVAGLQHFTKLTQDFTKAVEDNQRAFDAANPSLASITEAAQRYGLSLDDLGPKVQQLRIDEAASQIVQDFQVLTAAGADTAVIIAAMGDELQELVNHARKTGAALPAALRPILTHMVEAGTLTDEAGNKMEDLESLTWAETLDEKIGGLVDTMHELIGVIRDGIGGALDTIGNRVVEPVVRVRYEVDDLPEARLPGVVPMASGGLGRVTRPTLFLAGEAGPEDVAFSGAHRRFGEAAMQRIQVFLDRHVLIDETMRGMAEQFQLHAIGAR